MLLLSVATLAPTLRPASVIKIDPKFYCLTAWRDGRIAAFAPSTGETLLIDAKGVTTVGPRLVRLPAYASRSGQIYPDALHQRDDGTMVWASVDGTISVHLANGKLKNAFRVRDGGLPVSSRINSDGSTTVQLLQAHPKVQEQWTYDDNGTVIRRRKGWLLPESGPPDAYHTLLLPGNGEVTARYAYLRVINGARQDTIWLDGCVGLSTRQRQQIRASSADGMPRPLGDGVSDDAKTQPLVVSAAGNERNYYILLNGASVAKVNRKTLQCKAWELPSPGGGNFAPTAIVATEKFVATLERVPRGQSFVRIWPNENNN